MRNAQWELASVLLEIVAFFLVTIELYGEDRLRVFHARLIAAMSKVRVFSEKDEDFFLNPFVGYVLYPLMFVGSFLLRPYVQTNYPSDWFVIPGWWIIMGFIWCFLVLVPILEMMIVFHWLIRLGLFTLHQVRLRGLLLTIGALLFVCAKGIQVARLVPELTLW
ncbi:MAG: hypothetical protein WCH75_17620 [Candidatus Binatia bacterium]